MSIKQRGEVIGYVLQNPNQMICKTMIYDEVALGLRNMGISEEEIKHRHSEKRKSHESSPNPKKRKTIIIDSDSSSDSSFTYNKDLNRGWYSYVFLLSF